MNPLDNIRVVLVGTLYTGNVGSSCRAMANMGIRHLRLAAPNLQNSWDEGERMAVHATDIMNAREEFATFEEAVADCVAVVGTTAREGLYRQHVKAPRDCAADILSIAETGPVAVVFGREDKGLLNEEVAQCTHLVRIPVDEGYTSINLSQAVLITCYELFTASACTGFTLLNCDITDNAAEHLLEIDAVYGTGREGIQSDDIVERWIEGHSINHILIPPR